MGSLAKLVSYPDKILAVFFLRVLPELLRLTILVVCITWKSYTLVATKYKYVSTINEKSSKFCYRRRTRPDLHEFSVCLTDYAEGEEVRELADCKHAFHRSCLEKWLKGYKATCPLCRNSVVPQVVVAEYCRRMQAEEEDKWIEEELALILLNALDGRGCNGFF